MKNRYVIPFTNFYDEVFKKILIITGTGRSGTSILGRFVGSMRPVYYLFEPTLPKYCLMPDIMKSILWEDYVMPVIQGRNLNIDNRTESWTGNFWTEKEIKSRWMNLIRRIDLIPFIEKESPWIAIKLTEWQGMYETMKEMFGPDMRYLHIVRNGNDVISSSMVPGWYNEVYMTSNIVDWVEQRQKEDSTWYNIPWFVGQETKDLWHTYNEETRIAAAWRCTVEIGLGETDNYKVVRYEDLCERPENLAFEIGKWLDVAVTTLTGKHIESTRQHQVKKHPNMVDKIQQPEKDKFCGLMERLGYEV